MAMKLFDDTILFDRNEVWAVIKLSEPVDRMGLKHRWNEPSGGECSETVIRAMNKQWGDKVNLGKSVWQLERLIKVYMPPNLSDRELERNRRLLRAIKAAKKQMEVE